MSSNPVRLQLLLHKYIHNSASKAELDEFWKLMSELSDNDLVQMDLQNLWNNKQEPDPAAAVNWNKAYNILQQKIATQEFSYIKKIQSVKWKRIAYTGVAASLIACVIVFGWRFSRNTPDKIAKPQIAAVTRQERHQTLSLPDGTMVTLNEGSKLDYPAAFNQSSRDVYLTGEAYFDVKHDASKPFLVHTGSFVTKVLGTAFNIKAYAGDKQVSVTVTRGKVQVQSDNNKETLGVLIAGDQLIIDRVSADASLVQADVKKVLEWKATDMIFDNATVDEAIIALGNRYGITFHFEKESLRKCRFTANFTNDSLSQSLDVICTLINASWQQKEGTPVIEMKGAGCE